MHLIAAVNVARNRRRRIPSAGGTLRDLTHQETATVSGGLAPLIIGAIASNLGFAPGYIAIAIFLCASALFMAIFGPETGKPRTRAPEPPDAAVAPPAAARPPGG